jgi:regulator of protease activity HflC (stomatin/prohibitin superfamily)
MKKIFLLTLILGLGLVVNGYCADPVYTEKVVIGKVEVLEDGQIQIREDTKVYKDGVEISKTYQRHVIEPGQELSKEDDRVEAVANAVWTTDVVTAFKAEKAKLLEATSIDKEK